MQVKRICMLGFETFNVDNSISHGLFLSFSPTHRILPELVQTDVREIKRGGGGE